MSLMKSCAKSNPVCRLCLLAQKPLQADGRNYLGLAAFYPGLSSCAADIGYGIPAALATKTGHSKVGK